MGQGTVTRLVEAVVTLRRTRSRALPGVLFRGEMGWDMLLELFLADARGEPVTGRKIVPRVQGFERTAEHWLVFLTAERLIVGDGQGNLDDVITLTPKALGAIETWASSMSEIVQAALCEEPAIPSR